MSPDRQRGEQNPQRPFSRMIELAKKTQHSSVFVPLNSNRSCRAANPLLVCNFDLRHKKYAQSGPTETQAPIEILAMQKIVFVHRTDYRQCLARNQHESTGDSLYVAGYRRQRCVGQVKVACSRARTEQPRWQAAVERRFQCRDTSAATALFAAIEVTDQATGHPNARMLTKNGYHCRQRSGPNQAIGVKQQDKFPARLCQQAVGRRRKTEVATVGENSAFFAVVESNAELFNAVVVRTVVADQDFERQVTGQYRFDAARQPRAAVEIDDENGNKGLGHQRSGTKRRNIRC